jgi:hypothetical protein
MEKGSSKVKASIAAVLWYVMLLTLTPAISKHWTFLAFTTIPADLIRTTSSVVYVAVSIAILLLFLALAGHRRIVFGAFVSSLFILHFYTDEPSLDRILSFVFYSVIAAILLETWRQNIPLYRELKASRKSISWILTKSLILWSPALIFIFIGFFINYLIGDATRNALYESGLLDQYCSVRGDPDQTFIPCTTLSGRLRTDQITELTLEENVRRQVENIFFLRKKAMLEELSNQSPGAWMNKEGVLKEMSRVFKQLQAVHILNMEDAAPPFLDYARDPEIAVLGERLRAVNAKLAGIEASRTAGGLRQMLQARQQIAALEKEQAQCYADIRSRQSVLRRQEQEKDRVAFKVKSLRKALYSELAKIESEQPSTTLRQQLTDLLEKTPKPSEVLATMKVAVLRTMPTVEKQAQDKISAILKPHTDIAYEVGLMRRLCRLKDSAGTGNDDFVFACLRGSDKRGWVLEPLSFRESLDLTVRRRHERSERDLERSLVNSALAVDAGAAGIKRMAHALLEPIPRQVGLGIKDCGADPACHISNYARRTAERAYTNARSDLEAKLAGLANSRVGAAALSVNEQIDVARSGLYDALAQVRDGFEDAVDHIAKIGSIASALLGLWLLLAIIKSLLYVIGTEVFHVKGSAIIGLGREGNAEGAFERSTNIAIPASFTKAMLTTTVGINQGKKTAVPQPFSAMLARLLHGKWLMNRGTHAGNGTMRFAQSGGRVGIDWKMKEGEEVVFRYSDLLGFSENVKLRTNISLRLSTLLFGRYVYHSARCVDGPGRLLLSVKGDVEEAQHKVETFPLERLIAWHIHTKFKVTDERTLASVFKDGFTVQRVRDDNACAGIVLVGAQHGRERRFQGIFRFVKTFLVPF